MSTLFPEVIPTRRMVTLGGQRTGRDLFRVELQTQSLADVRSYVRWITIDETAAQISIGNPPSLLEVDGRRGKPIEDVDKRTDVLFGTVLAAAAMREVEAALREAIARSTTTRSGTLVSVESAWSWRYLPKGGGARVVSANTPLPAFALGDQLVLLPERVPYATIVNRAVARSGRANVAPRKGKSPPKSRQNKGFLFHAADVLRRKSSFKQFHVRVVFTRAHMVAGEVMTRTSGTGLIVISPRARRV
jgi:hypothetical protein